jgi:hypothetical protein
MTLSRPALVNDLFWQNRTFHVNLVGPGAGLVSQQNLVVIAPGAAANNTPLAAQAGSGQCPAGASYWDVGLRTDDVQSGLLSAARNRLAITNSILTGTNDISGLNEVVASGTNRIGLANPVNAQICNGARVPPELCNSGGNTSLSGAASCLGFNAPPGASETTSTSQLFVFSGIHPTATVDEGHNWLNLVYGPLTLARPGVSTPTAGEQMLTVASTGLNNGAYSIPINSPAVAGGVGQAGNDHDFFGNSRPTSGSVAIGAVERRGTPTSASVAPSPLAFGTWAMGTTSDVRNLTVTNTGTNALAGGTVTGIAAPFARVTTGTFPTNSPNCGATLAVGATCTIKIQFAPTTAVSSSQNVTIAFTGATVTPTPVVLSGTGVAATATTSVSPSTLTIAAATPVPNTSNKTGTGTVTLTNTAPAGTGAQMTITSVAVTGTGFSLVAGQNNCTGVTLAQGASCTVGVGFTSATNHSGTIRFTDNASGSPQSGTLTGVVQ